MSFIKRKAGVLVLAGLLFLTGFWIFSYCTNFGQPYVSGSSGAQLQLTVWFFRWPHLFRATYELDASEKWEAAEIAALFSITTQVYCRRGQVQLIITNGKPVFLQDPEDDLAPEGDIRVATGQLIMASVKKATEAERFLGELPKPKKSDTPNPNT